jgi:hypothetical protein
LKIQKWLINTVNWRRSDNTMVKRKDKRQIIVILFVGMDYLYYRWPQTYVLFVGMDYLYYRWWQTYVLFVGMDYLSYRWPQTCFVCRYGLSVLNPNKHWGELTCSGRESSSCFSHHVTLVKNLVISLKEDMRTWPLYCLTFFNLQYLLTTFESSNISYSYEL